ncbi:MAG TPA: YCF48-related protein [Chitinophagaceae bacterium]
MKRVLILSVLLITQVYLFAQSLTVDIIASGTNTNLRGLSVVNDNIIWVSGSNGTVGKSSNGGKNWKWMTVKGFEKKDFRDIEAFDANTAIIMAIQEPAYILKTTDGGETWKVVYENKTKGMFLDAMDFATPQYGVVVGDPINGNVFLAETNDGGNSWTEIYNKQQRLAVDSGEAFFAASGSNIRLYNTKDIFIVSGGTKSRFIVNDKLTPLPLLQGKETTGANAIDIFDDGIPNKPGKRMIVVGGDFADPKSTEKNCFISTDRGKTWKAPKTAPKGYRSCVEFLSKNDVLTCGLNGVDYSRDGGKNWNAVSTESFNVCRIARIGTSVFLAGSNGRIGRFVSR